MFGLLRMWALVKCLACFKNSYLVVWLSPAKRGAVDQNREVSRHEGCRRKVAFTRRTLWLHLVQVVATHSNSLYLNGLIFQRMLLCSCQANGEGTLLVPMCIPDGSAYLTRLLIGADICWFFNQPTFCWSIFLMTRRPPRSTQSRSSAASDVYKRQDPPHLSLLVRAKLLNKNFWNKPNT